MSLRSVETPSGVDHPIVAKATSLSFEHTLPRVGKYRILAELGRGGMANVFLAMVHGPSGVNKLVVLKALRPELAAEPYALSMFLDEARLAAQLNHPNVVQTYEIGAEGDRHVMVMEYLEGQTLSALLKRGEEMGEPLPISMHLRILISTLEGLHYAHEFRSYDGALLELVHRDISPQNIFVTYEGQVKVLDFGIAKAASSSTQTETGVVKGKIAYMAPEQTVADSVDRRADVYSVGCLLWALATGRKLWKDTPDVQIMRRVVNGEIPSPRSVNPECDDELERIVMKALAHDRAQRYQTAQDFQQDLEAYSERQAQAKQKDLARYIGRGFAEKRAELRTLIEARLASADQEKSSPSAALRESLSLPVPGGTHESNGYLSGAVVTAPTVRGRQRTFGLLALAAAALIGLGILWKAKGHATAETAARPMERAASVAPQAAIETTVQFRVLPVAAKLFLDDRELPANLSSKVMPIDNAVHRLRAEMAGYAATAAEFSVAPGATVEITLHALPVAQSETNDKKSKAALRSLRGARAIPTTSAATGATTAEHKGCDEPFYVTPDGIRKIRPECI